MEIVVGALAAWGLLMLLWTLLGLCLLPLSRRKDLSLTVVVKSQAEPLMLERYIKGLLWLRDLGLIWWRIVLLTDTKDVGTRLLPDCFGQVEIMSPEEFSDWVEE